LSFAKLKSLLRNAEEPTVSALMTLLGKALDAFSPDECRNCFPRCGYNAARS
jgi:hypothetical protein